MPQSVTRRRFVSGTIRLALVSPLVTLRPRMAAGAAAPRFSARERDTLRAAADALIPADGRMPAASAVGAVRYVERVAAADEKLRALLADGFRALDGEAPRASRTASTMTATLQRFEKGEATQPFFAALRDLVYEAYYTHPRVWKLLGYNFRSGRKPTAPLESFDEQRLARVRALAPLYRRVP